MRVLLVDPSLFTGPYDAALDEGLRSQGVATMWAVRPIRAKDRQEIPAAHCAAFFYRHSDEGSRLRGPLRALAKGVEHVAGMVRLVALARRGRYDVVHFQWVVVPPVDTVAMWILRRFCAVVLTVHDTVPFNGERISALQNFGFDAPIRLAHRVIVHTQAGRATLIARGIPQERIQVVEHGPLKMHQSPSAGLARTDARYTLAMFGEIKPYKGLDLLVDAVAQLPDDVRSGLRIVVAGRPRMDMQPVLDRVAALGLQSVFDFQLERLTHQEMADLFASVDGFVFPYRQIDASGVYFLVKGRGQWLIASRVGIFAEDMIDGVDGRLVAPEDIAALSAALLEAARTRAVGRALSSDGGWHEIGEKTCETYRRAITERSRHAD